MKRLLLLPLALIGVLSLAACQDDAETANYNLPKPRTTTCPKRRTISR